MPNRSTPPSLLCGRGPGSQGRFYSELRCIFHWSLVLQPLRAFLCVEGQVTAHLDGRAVEWHPSPLQLTSSLLPLFPTVAGRTVGVASPRFEHRRKRQPSGPFKRTLVSEHNGWYVNTSPRCTNRHNHTCAALLLCLLSTKTRRPRR
eukprot:gene6680-biopygen23915